MHSVSQSKFICHIEDITDGGARGFSLPNEPGLRTIFLVRQGKKIYGYWNCCAHLGTPLDWKPDHFFNLSKTHLQCATHGAEFRIKDGYCIAGPCKGKSLESIPLHIKEKKIYLKI